MTKEQTHLTEKDALLWKEAPGPDLCVLVCARSPPSSSSSSLSLSPMPSAQWDTLWGMGRDCLNMLVLQSLQI